MNTSKTDEILTHKRCGILLVTSCLIYFLLNITWLAQGIVPAFSGAICATVAFALFLYFIRVIVKEKEKKEKQIKDGKNVTEN